MRIYRWYRTVCSLKPRPPAVDVAEWKLQFCIQRSFLFLPALAFVLLEIAWDARSIDIVFGTPYLSMVSCCWTLMIRNGPSALAWTCYESVYLYLSIYSFPPPVVACQQILAHFQDRCFAYGTVVFVHISLLRCSQSTVNVFSRIGHSFQQAVA